MATDPSKSHLSKRSFRGNSGSGALPTWFSFEGLGQFSGHTHFRLEPFWYAKEEQRFASQSLSKHLVNLRSVCKFSVR